MNIKLLQEAADIVSAIPKKQFNLDVWVDSKTVSKPNSDEVKPANTTCGTIACAGGWLALTPKFNRKGLKLLKLEYDSSHSLYHVDKNGHKAYGYKGLGAVFDITEYEAMQLFASRNHGIYDSEILKMDDRSRMSDRRLFKERVKKFLKANQQ